MVVQDGFTSDCSGETCHHDVEVTPSSSALNTIHPCQISSENRTEFEAETSKNMLTPENQTSSRIIRPNSPVEELVSNKQSNSCESTARQQTVTKCEGGVAFVIASSVKDGIYVLSKWAGNNSVSPEKISEEKPEKLETGNDPMECDKRQIDKGNDLLEEVCSFSHDLPKINEENPSSEGGEVQNLAVSLKQHLGSFSEKLEGTREKIEDTAKCYQLMDKSYEWALEAMRFVSHMGIDNTESSEGIMKQIQCLQEYSENHLKVPEDTFTEMLELATKLGNEKLLEQCRVVKQRCEETVELIQARQTTLQKVKQQIEVDSLRGPFWEAEDANQTPRTMRSNSQPLNSWLPIGASTPYSISLSSHQRRRSTGGPMNLPSSNRYGSPIGSYTSFPNAYYPATKESYQFDNYIQEKEKFLRSQGIITEDWTSHGPVASISKTLLGLRSGHRHSPCSSSSSSSASSCSKVC